MFVGITVAFAHIVLKSQTYRIWKNQFGAHANRTSSAAFIVHEAANATLIAAAAALLTTAIGCGPKAWTVGDRANFDRLTTVWLHENRAHGFARQIEDPLSAAPEQFAPFVAELDAMEAELKALDRRVLATAHPDLPAHVEQLSRGVAALRRFVETRAVSDLQAGERARTKFIEWWIANRSDVEVPTK
jgi:hypothetical protein